MRLTIYTDGGARGNPGPAAIGVVIYDNKEKIKEFKKCIGIATNNQAEYTAMIKAFELAKDLKAKELKVYSDSELLIRQVTGEYRVKNEKLKELFSKLKSLEKNFTVSYEHVFRENPGIVNADRLVNEALDGV